VHLVRPQPVELQQEVPRQLEAARSGDIRPHHPAADSLRIKLLIPRRVQRVRKVHSLSVPADLHHLGPAVQRFLGLAGVRRAPHDSTNLDGSRWLRMERIGNVVPPHLPRSPAGHVQELIVEGKIEIRECVKIAVPAR
jgi:hypothetical protein